MTQIINFVKGIFIGIAVVIPGLSGSIFAVVVGLYEKMIHAVSDFRKNIKKNILFLLPIVLGAVVGILLSTKLILMLCETYTQQAYFFFIGLVLGSIPLVLRKLKGKKFHPAYLLITLFSMGLILLMGFFSNADAGEGAVNTAYYLTGLKDTVLILFSGFLSCALMSIPGVSGSVTLMVLGQYNKVYGAVSECTDMLKYLISGEFDRAWESSRSIWLVLAFAIGGIAGFILISKLIAKLLAKFEAQTYYGVGGMILGAIIILFVQGVMTDQKFTSAFQGSMTAGILGMLVLDLVLIAVGVVCTLFLDDDSELAQRAKKKGVQKHEE
ncbi:MAG: DUF368 domain-containing protein [Clostridiales bacterium]|jgi:hypothetical protein|nr:DUF368 domain-containing protein [Clostridiales bacterium]PWM22802.1 MAG: DUF368 domain-containing protein [Clostridiales bacterium]